MNMAIFGDLFVGIRIADLGGTAVMTKERHIGHGYGDLGYKPCRGDGDSSALRAACHCDTRFIHFGMAACCFDGTHSVGEDSAIVIVLWFKDALGHTAWKMGIAAIGI